jgi:hypothetical protein
MKDQVSARLMIRPEPAEPQRARVIGELTGEAVDILLAAVECGLTVLDLSEVDQADDGAVRALARLRPERCTLVSVPRWLELWIAKVRGAVVVVPQRNSRVR